MSTRHSLWNLNPITWNSSYSRQCRQDEGRTRPIEDVDGCIFHTPSHGWNPDRSGLLYFSGSSYQIYPRTFWPADMHGKRCDKVPCSAMMHPQGSSVHQKGVHMWSTFMNLNQQSGKIRNCKLIWNEGGFLGVMIFWLLCLFHFYAARVFIELNIRGGHVWECLRFKC